MVVAQLRGIPFRRARLYGTGADQYIEPEPNGDVFEPDSDRRPHGTDPASSALEDVKLALGFERAGTYTEARSDVTQRYLKTLNRLRGRLLARLRTTPTAKRKRGPR